MQIERSNEIKLIQQTLAGDTSAFDQLVKTHRTTIYMLVLSYIKNPADAEDLTQRVFIRAYERLATLRDLNCFLPWLQRIARNTCKNWLCRRVDSPTDFEALNDTDFAETAPSPEEIALKREIETVVREAIGTLPETDRKLVEARYIEGASYDQLQIESGLSYAAIANRLKRAKQQMRRRIEKLLGGMAILPGRTFIWGGIETVKLSVKTKLAAVGVAAVLGIGGGVWYHQTFELNPIIVNGQRGSEPEVVTEEDATVESPKSPSQADIAETDNIDSLPQLQESEPMANEEANKLALAHPEVDLSQVDLTTMTREEIIAHVKSLPKYKEIQQQANILTQKERELYQEYIDYEHLWISIRDKIAVGPITAKDMKVLESMRQDGQISDADYKRYKDIYDNQGETQKLYKLFKQQEEYINQQIEKLHQQLDEIRSIRTELRKRQGDIWKSYGID